MYTGGGNCVRFIIVSDFYCLFLKCYIQNFEYFFQIIFIEIELIRATVVEW